MLFNIRTSKLIENVDINENDITRIVKSLNSNKSHGLDNLSIRMINVCGQSISSLLKLIFTDSVVEEIFPESSRKANFVPVPSLLRIFGKVSEPLIFNDYIIILSKTNFLQNFKCFFIVQEVNLSFDCASSVNVRGVL